MVYKYFCVDCGNENMGAEIAFDLAELAGMTLGAGQNRNRYALVTQDELKRLVLKTNNAFRHRVRVPVHLTVGEFLLAMARNSDLRNHTQLVDEITDVKYSEIKKILQQIYSTNESAEVVDELIDAWHRQIQNTFELTKSAERAIEDSDDPDYKSLIEQNLDNYETVFYIEPEFFENGRSDVLYSIRHCREQHAANPEVIKAPEEVRGYCPKCGKPVLKGAGMYKHVLVGFLGVQSAGKTSLMMSLVTELVTSYVSMGLYFPGGALCDSRHDTLKVNERLFKNGWAVVKTNADSNEGTFNISVLLRSKAPGVGGRLVTFVDIAGEQCYNIKEGKPNVNAMQTYPLIGRCDVYLLCICSDQTGYGNASGDDTFIPAEAAVAVASGFYQEFERNRRMPPLCITLTKADMAADGGRHAPDNPFEDLRPVDPRYVLASQLSDLAMMYDVAPTQGTREPLRQCVNMLHNMEGISYTAILSTAALGRKAQRFVGNEEDIRPYTIEKNGERVEVPFQRRGVRELWDWLLQLIGLSPIKGTNPAVFLPRIPDFRERYFVRGVSNGKPENYFEANDQAVRERLIAIGRLFIGASKTDLALDRVLRIPMPDRRRDIPNWEKRIPNYVLRARINVLSPAEQFAAAQNKNK